MPCARTAFFIPFSSENGFGDDVTIVLDLAAIALGDEALAPTLGHFFEKFFGEDALFQTNRSEVFQQRKRVWNV